MASSPMSRSLGRIAVTALALLVSACFSPTPFQPAERDNPYGYRVERLEQDHFRIGFSGNSRTSEQQVKDALAYLAARVTVRNGGDYFVVTTDKLDQLSVYDPLGSRSEYVRCCRTRGLTSHEFEGTAEIMIFKGEAPSDNPSAHDAQEVIHQLGPRITRGEGRSLY
jgi:hypothetical protein